MYGRCGGKELLVLERDRSRSELSLDISATASKDLYPAVRLRK